MLRRTTTAALLALALGASAQQPAPPAEPAPTLSNAELFTLRGSQRLQQGDLRGALAAVNEALARDSRYAGAYALRGTIRLNSGDRAGAFADMNRAIELGANEPGIEVVYANRAHVHWLEGRAPEAGRDAARALEINPAYAPALHVRARIKADLGDLDGARADLDRAVQISPKMMSVYATRAAVHLAAGRLQESLSDYKTLMWTTPRDAEAIAGHGIVRGLLGETEAALTDLIRARSISPLSVYAGDKASPTSPVRLLEQYRIMNPMDARATLMSGVIRVMNMDVPAGEKDLERAVRLDPKLQADAQIVRRHIAR
jgi:tetratricopeptide (TPR) repeat protein